MTDILVEEVGKAIGRAMWEQVDDLRGGEEYLLEIPIYGGAEYTLLTRCLRI